MITKDSYNFHLTWPLPRSIAFFFFFISLIYIFYSLTFVYWPYSIARQSFSTHQQYDSMINPCSPSHKPINNHVVFSPTPEPQESTTNFSDEVFSPTPKPLEKTNIFHMVFGIAASAKLWNKRKQYIKLW